MHIVLSDVEHPDFLVEKHTDGSEVVICTNRPPSDLVNFLGT
jgi:hypothetical protein